MGHLRFFLVLAAAALAALAVWTWLPPTQESQDAIKQSIVRYDLASRIPWPEGHYGETVLPRVVQDQLLHEWRANLDETAEGDALTTASGYDPVEWLLTSRREQPDRVVLKVDGEVVLFDVRRRTLRGEVIVRAAVAQSIQTGTWDAKSRRVRDATWTTSDSCAIYDYVMRERGDTWKVVDRAPPKDGPFFYNPDTGETGSGP